MITQLEAFVLMNVIPLAIAVVIVTVRGIVRR